MKNQVLFSVKGKTKKLKVCLLQFLFGALRVKHEIFHTLKAPITTAADDILKYFFIVFQKK